MYMTFILQNIITVSPVITIIRHNIGDVLCISTISIGRSNATVSSANTGPTLVLSSLQIQ